MERDFLSKSLSGIFRIRTAEKSTIYYPSLSPWGVFLFPDGIIFILAFLIILVTIGFVIPLSIPLLGLILLSVYLAALFTFTETITFSKNKVWFVKYKFLIPVYKASTSPANCHIFETYKCRHAGEQTGIKIDIIMQWDWDTSDFVSLRVNDKEYCEGTYNDKQLWGTIQEEASRFIPYWPENNIPND